MVKKIRGCKYIIVTLEWSMIFEDNISTSAYIQHPARMLRDGKLTTPLTHETRNDPMEDTASVAKPLLASAQSFEVGGRPGHNFTIQTKFNPTERLSVGSNVKVDGIGNVGRGGSSSPAAEQVAEEVEGGWHHVQVVVVADVVDDLMFGRRRHSKLRRYWGKCKAFLPWSHGSNGEEEGEDGFHGGCGFVGVGVEQV